MRYTPKYPVKTDLKGIEIVTKQYNSDFAKAEPASVEAKAEITKPTASVKAVNTLPTEEKRTDTQPKRTVPLRTVEPAKPKTVTDEEYEDIFGIEKPQRKRVKHENGSKAQLTVGRIVGRFFAVLATVLVLAVISVYAICFTIARGPSEKVRDLLVLSALQASATKWVPDLFLPSDVVDEIYEKSQQSTIQIVDPSDYDVPTSDDPSDKKVDEWENAIDGMQFITIRKSTFKAYMLIVKDPSRVFTATSCDFKNTSPTYGVTIFTMAENYGVVAAINAGEYEDIGGQGTGDKPIGLIYQNGELVWDDGNYYHTFIGFDTDNKMVVRESMTPELAKQYNIRDGVMFQWNNVLIEKTDDGIVAHRSDSNIGTAQRTAIAQRADGAVILLVTDGRTASSIGATKNDIIDLLLSYHAETAAMLDGGSSAMMFYRDYFNKYDYDTSKLDKYQLLGLVNQYKAFTTPRRMPTFFAVKPE